MLRYGKFKVRKGYILLYVLFTGLLCLLMVTFMVKLEFERNRTEELIRKEILAQSYEVKCREHLLSEFRRHLINNNVPLDTASINTYLSNNQGAFRINFETSSLTYTSAGNYLIGVYPYDIYKKRYEYYSVKAEGGKLRFTIENVKLM